MPGFINPNLFVLVHLNNPAILNDKAYRSKPNRLQRITHQTLQFPAPKICSVAAHPRALQTELLRDNALRRQAGRQQ